LQYLIPIGIIIFIIFLIIKNKKNKKIIEQKNQDKLRLEELERRKKEDEENLLYNSAMQGDLQAQLAWGDLMCEKNESQQSYIWYKKAAEQGNKEAQYKLGTMYYNGIGIEKDYYQAIVWLKNAYKQGHKEAGILAMQIGKEAIKIQEEEKIRTTAIKGDPQSQFDLGDLLFEKKEYKQGSYWYKKASEQNHAEAQYKLALNYYLGTGIEEDYSQALFWAIKAFNQGHLKANTLISQIKEKEAKQKDEEEQTKAASFDITLW